MIRGIGILLCTHIFDDNKNIQYSDNYIFGKKLSKKIRYIKKLLGE